MNGRVLPGQYAPVAAALVRSCNILSSSGRRFAVPLVICKKFL